MRNAFVRTILVALMLGLTFAAGSWSRAQSPRVTQPPATAKVYSGGDVGFRVEGKNGTVPSGRLVIRNDAGEWVEVDFAVGIKRLTSQ